MSGFTKRENIICAKYRMTTFCTAGTLILNLSVMILAMPEGQLGWKFLPNLFQEQFNVERSPHEQSREFTLALKQPKFMSVYLTSCVKILNGTPK